MLRQIRHSGRTVKLPISDNNGQSEFKQCMCCMHQDEVNSTQMLFKSFFADIKMTLSVSSSPSTIYIF